LCSEMDFLSKLKSFDSFGKSREHVQVRTLSGATGARGAHAVLDRGRRGYGVCVEARGMRSHQSSCSFCGAAVSLATFVLVLALFFSELIWYRSKRVEHHLMVDTSQVRRRRTVTACTGQRMWGRTWRGHPCALAGRSAFLQGDRDLDVKLDIDFHALKCEQVDFRVEDSKGIAYDDLRVHMTKSPLTAGEAGRLTGRLAGCCRALACRPPR
jgi:hypothetical protein